jgi:hypothetical protein
MSDDESLDRQGQRQAGALSSEAADWGSQFVKLLELEYVSAAAGLQDNATWEDYRQAMLNAVAEVLLDSGAAPREIAHLLEETGKRLSPIGGHTAWTKADNARRLELIDKWIQKTLSGDEAVELEQLTAAMRAHCDIEATVPLEGARRLHRQLLDMDETEQKTP